MCRETLASASAAAKRSTLYRTAPHQFLLRFTNISRNCNALQHAATHCNVLQHTQHTQHTPHSQCMAQTCLLTCLLICLPLTNISASQCNILQHTATRTTPQHTQCMAQICLPFTNDMRLCIATQHAARRCNNAATM